MKPRSQRTWMCQKLLRHLGFSNSADGYFLVQIALSKIYMHVVIMIGGKIVRDDHKYRFSRVRT